jgi:Na+(H+)/acetate symporter ActP
MALAYVVLVIDRVMMAVMVMMMRSMMLVRRISKARVGEKKQNNSHPEKLNHSSTLLPFVCVAPKRTG